MSRKWMFIAGVVILAVVLVVAAVLVMKPHTTPQSGVSTTGNGSSTSSVSASSGTIASHVGSATATTGSTSTGTKTGTIPNTIPGGIPGSTSTGSPTSQALAPLKVFPPMPKSTLPPHAATSPAAPGSTLAPLSTAPTATVAALKLGLVPDGSQYAITMRPYGIGPSIVFGTRMVVLVDSTRPLSGAPTNSHLNNANMLVVLDTTHGGSLTKGGTYTATLTFRSDGSKLLPILSNAKLK